LTGGTGQAAVAMTDEHIYLDHNATTAAHRDVIEAVREVMARASNPSSVHGPGRAARQLVEAARASVARLVGAEAANVVFTSGGTEADNLALKGSGARRLMIAASEHGAILAPALLRDAGAVILAVDGDGLLDLDGLAAALEASDKPALVSVMLANNETGVIQPLAEISELAKAHGALVHTDAVQAAGKIPVDITSLGVDMLSLSGHKIGGPQGVGALVLGGDLAIEAEIVGGGQERGRRSGTENVAGIHGFGRAAEIAAEHLSAYGGLARLRDEMERRLTEIAPGRRIFGDRVARLPNTSCATMPDVDSQTQVMAFDLAGIAVSAGSACSSGKVAASHVLEAMGVAREVAATALRVSLGWGTSAAEIDRFVEVWAEIYRRAGRRVDAA
jgi:cysteine desulfurase